ncbi:MAG: CheY-like chemotaxis protein [Hyphomicrobiaceae bacterium]|jgi:CheY-like chemotaxis protein
MSKNKVTFLLVEDDDVDVMILKRSFKRAGIPSPIVVARDGVEALEILRGQNGQGPLPKPHIVLLDLNMPRMNGIEFLDSIRNDAELAPTVVFVLTTSSDEHDKRKAYERNIAGYLVKKPKGSDLTEDIEMLGLYSRTVEFLGV